MNIINGRENRAHKASGGINPGTLRNKVCLPSPPIPSHHAFESERGAEFVLDADKGRCNLHSEEEVKEMMNLIGVEIDKVKTNSKDELKAALLKGLASFEGEQCNALIIQNRCRRYNKIP